MTFSKYRDDQFIVLGMDIIKLLKLHWGRCENMEELCWWTQKSSHPYMARGGSSGLDIQWFQRGISKKLRYKASMLTWEGDTSLWFKKTWKVVAPLKTIILTGHTIQGKVLTWDNLIKWSSLFLLLVFNNNLAWFGNFVGKNIYLDRSHDWSNLEDLDWE